jgi:hypothetical protein
MTRHLRKREDRDAGAGSASAAFSSSLESSSRCVGLERPARRHHRRHRPRSLRRVREREVVLRQESAVSRWVPDERGEEEDEKATSIRRPTSSCRLSLSELPVLAREQ